MPEIKLSDAPQAVYAVSGHVGVGHVHSHSGFVQDDSAGFAVASLILKQAVETNTTIKEACADPLTNTIKITTAEGGTGTLSPRRGITPREAELVKAIEGEDALYTQNMAVKAFGRIYGQGVSEAAACLQGACALAVMDSFRKTLGSKLLVTKEALAGKYDISAGTMLEIDGTPVSLMLVINGTDGGIGPDEDYEGNTDWTEKGEIMRALGADKVPTAVIESKAYIPSIAPQLTENQFMIRAEKGIDCEEMGKALYEAAQELSLPSRYETAIMPLSEGALAAATAAFADKVIAAAQKLRTADLASEKTQLTAEIAKLISEDAGGVTFMSSSINDKVRGAGILPGISAVISMVTTEEYVSQWKIPMLEKEEAENYIKVIMLALKKLKDI